MEIDQHDTNNDPKTRREARGNGQQSKSTGANVGAVVARTVASLEDSRLGTSAGNTYIMHALNEQAKNLLRQMVHALICNYGSAAFGCRCKARLDHAAATAALVSKERCALCSFCPSDNTQHHMQTDLTP